MNNQNLVSKKFLTRFAGKKVVKTATICIIPILLCLLVVCFVRVGIGFSVKSKEAKLSAVQAERSEYVMAQDSVTSLQAQVSANLENINYFKDLNRQFADYDLMMDYIIKTKPSGVTILSIEDASIVPNSETATVTDKLKPEDIMNGQKENLPSYVPNTAGTSELEITESGDIPSEEMVPEPTPPVVGDETVSSELPPNTIPTEPLPDGTMPEDLNTGAEQNPAVSNKYREALFYTKDIGQGDILLRGYAVQASQISKYIVSLSEAPQISGYTIEGTENKNAQINGAPVILFELKLSLKGDSAHEPIS